MSKVERIKYAETVIFKLLLDRFNKYIPKKYLSLLEIIEDLEWGKSLLNSLDDIEITSLIEKLNGKVDDDFTPLRSIFSELSITYNYKPKETYYAPVKWDDPVIYSNETRPTELSLQEYWKMVLSDFKVFIRQLPDDEEARLTKVLLWSYTWLNSVPINKTKDTISLANYISTISSIAVASYKTNGFKIILGDISGIQSYLFDISHIGAGKVAKRLRARSFTLGLLSEASAHKLLLANGLPISNMLISAGGIFYCILPIDADISHWMESINKSLFEKYHGSISLHSASIDVDTSDFETKFPQILSNLYKEIQISKGKTFENILQKNNLWVEERFLHIIDAETEPCEGCRRHPKEKDGILCKFCFEDEVIGTHLVKTNYLAFRKGKGEINILEDIYVDLLADLLNIDNSTYLIQSWNKAEININNYIPVQKKWVANYVPVAQKGGCVHCEKTNEIDKIKEGQPLSFNCLAYYSEGRSLLGYLKADVDNLGLLFSMGLLDDEVDKAYSFEHIVTLSKILERFFSGGINQWLQQKYTNIYTVFSGGDDLFLIGPLSEILTASIEIRSYFLEYAGFNQDVTLSAGVVAAKEATPLPHIVRLVEESLEEAKENPNYFRLTENPAIVNGRDQINFRGFSLEWGDFEKIIEVAKTLSIWWREGKISSSFLYKLSHFSKLYHEYIDDNKIESLKFIPLLAYTIQRNFTENQSKEDRQEVINWATRLLRYEESEVKWLWTYMIPILELTYVYRKEKGVSSNGE